MKNLPEKINLSDEGFRMSESLEEEFVSEILGFIAKKYGCNADAICWDIVVSDISWEEKA